MSHSQTAVRVGSDPLRGLDLLAVVVGQPPDERRGGVLVLAGFGDREAVAARPAGVLAGRAGRLDDDADIAGGLRRLRIIEEGRPARPVEVERDRSRGEALAEVVPEIVGGAGRHGLGLVEIDEPVERAHARVRIEGGLALGVEIVAALGDDHFVEAPVDRLLLAGVFGAVEVRRAGEKDRLVLHLLQGRRRREVVAVFVLERLLLGVVGVVALEVIERGDVEFRPRQHHELAVDGRGLDVGGNELVDLLLRNQLRQIGVEIRVLRSERGVVGADAPFDRIGGDIRLELLVELEVVLFRDDVDLGAGELLPFGDAGVERFVFLPADQFRVDGDARKRTGETGGRRQAGRDEQRRQGRGHQGCALHALPPLGVV